MVASIVGGQLKSDAGIRNPLRYYLSGHRGGLPFLLGFRRFRVSAHIGRVGVARHSGHVVGSGRHLKLGIPLSGIS